jgi:RibD C-terminal domain
VSTPTKVLWHVTMSLDGYIEPPDHSIDWMFGRGKPGPVAGEVSRRTGAILAGRRGFDLGTRAGDGPRGIYGAGDRDVGVFGADVARQCLRAGLIDEIVVHVVPVLLGEGLRLFDSPGAPPVRLVKTRCDDPGQITDLTFEVVR